MRKIILILCLLVCVCLTACLDTSESADSKTGNDLTEHSVNQSGNDLIEYTVEKSDDSLRVYSASQSDGCMYLLQDYDTVISLCNDAMMEFVRAVANKDNVKTHPYIENKLLAEYMQYRAEHHSFQYDNMNEHRFFIEEVRFQDEYALVKGILAIYSGVDSYSLEGETFFLIKNVDGRLFIVEWYWDGMDSPDVLWRGDFSVDNNLTYWEDDAKYGEVIRKIREK